MRLNFEPYFTHFLTVPRPHLQVIIAHSLNAYWFSPDLPQPVLNVLAYDPADDDYYGISINKKTLKKSKFSSRMVWTGVPKKSWDKAKVWSSLITATEVPFVPFLPGDEVQPYDAFLFPSSAVSSKRSRRSAVNYNMWGGNDIAT